jgi:hypothetical protein
MGEWMACPTGWKCGFVVSIIQAASIKITPPKDDRQFEDADCAPLNERIACS